MLTATSQPCQPVSLAGQGATLNNVLQRMDHFSQKSTGSSVRPRLSSNLASLISQQSFLAFHHPLVIVLARWIASKPTIEHDFNEAVHTATSHGLAELQNVNITNLSSFLDYLTDYLYWTPTETVDGREIYRRCLISYFVLSQPSVIGYQNKIYPGSSAEPSTWLSQWMVSYGLAFGAHLDTPESMNEKSMATFRNASNFRIDDYIEPEGGWRTFNEFFSRQARPERRPITAPEDPSVWISPADCTYMESFPISETATVTVKTLEWTVKELLDGSSYASRFAGGLLVHGFLGVFDYHRFHAPVKGTVVESRKVIGRHYCMVDAMDADDQEDVTLTNSGPSKVLKKKKLDCPDDLGFEVAQTRGLTIFESPQHGLVAVVSVGMAQCSSVTLTAKPGDEVRKGDEFGYFRFGGSDAILLFEKKPEISVSAGKHILMGEKFGEWL